MSTITAPAPQENPTAGTALAYPDGRRLSATIDGEHIALNDAVSRQTSVWRLRGNALSISECATLSIEDSQTQLLAALEIAFNLRPNEERLTLETAHHAWETFLACGALQHDVNGYHAQRDLFWQQPRAWLNAPRPAFAQRHILSGDRRHPLRPPKPSGTVYQRHIPWLARTLSFRSIDIDRDLERFNRWMNDPAVAFFWQEQGDLAKHREYLSAIAADPRALGLIAALDGESFGYFEVYWAREDRIAPFYDAWDYDRGWHVLIGEPAFRGKPFLTAWMPSISHYLFLDDCRTQRLVIEPRIDNDKMLNSLARCGYAHLKAFDFPHKRAMLGQLSRERFFAEARWIPRADDNLFR